MQEKAREKREELLERERRGVACEKEALAKEIEEALSKREMRLEQAKQMRETTRMWALIVAAIEEGSTRYSQMPKEEREVAQATYERRPPVPVVLEVKAVENRHAPHQRSPFRLCSSC